MKAEINLENKAKFFALYWNQNIGIHNERTEGLRSIVNDTTIDSLDCLSLKPLSQISEEDAIELEYSVCNDPLNANYGMSASSCFLDDWDSRQDMLMSDADYLRSKGYAFSWMELSVDELVKAGWIQLLD